MLAGDAAVLRAISGDDPGRIWPLDRERVVIGRDRGADVHVNHRSISREHAEIVRRDGGYFIRDLGSKNGTRVNDQPVETPRLLQNKDVIELGKAVQFSFVGPNVTLTLAQGAMPTIGLKLDEDMRRVLVNGDELRPPLSQAQFRLLQLLIAAEGGVRAREDIIAAVWPEESGEGITEQAIDALVRRLRERLAELDPEHTYIITVRGHGFRFENR